MNSLRNFLKPSIIRNVDSKLFKNVLLCNVNKNLNVQTLNPRLMSLSSRLNDIREFSNDPKLNKYIKEEAKYNGKLVYVGSLSKQLKRAKVLSLSSSVFGKNILQLLILFWP
jgi:hypothetical protein